jgi:hypothetical protein
MVERTCKNKSEAQALANFLYREGIRHWDDIRKIVEDLRLIEKKWNVKPSPLLKMEFIKP